MAGARLTIDFNARGLHEPIAAWISAGRSPGQLLRPLIPRLVNNTQDRFDSEQDPEGQPWAALSPAYAAIKKGRGILHESGILQRTIAGDLRGDAIMIGSVQPYAAAHQFGATIKPRTQRALRFRTGRGTAFAASVRIPARPFLGVSREDERDIFEHLEDFFIRRAL